MLKPPFSTNIVFPPSSTQPCLHEPLPTSPTSPIDHALPTAVRRGTTLARIADDPDAYYKVELQTARLDDIKQYLWLAGLPRCGRPLHRHLLLGREIIITEDPNEHLVWHKTRIFIKPLPIFLLDLNCWTLKICKSKQVHEAACGFLLSYAWLVRHESDFRIAREKGLLPSFIHWAAWTEFINEFLEHIDLQSLSDVSPRYRYGELRLSRLNKIYCLTRFSWRTFLQGYISTSTWYQDFFARNFAWLLAAFALMSVALSAMQVILATSKGGKAFENASFGFAIASLFLAAGSALALLLVWGFLFLYHLVSAKMYNSEVMKERQHLLDSQGDRKC